jgi:hypothetical protein
VGDGAPQPKSGETTRVRIKPVTPNRTNNLFFTFPSLKSIVPH